VGIDAAENIYIFDMVREQVNTAERQILQQKTAEKDGKLVEIHAPEDPGAAGKDIAFDFEQVFARQGYKVTISKAGSGDDTSGNRAFSMSKTMRALGFSKAVNSSQVFLVLSQDGTTPDWHKPFKSELQHFPTSTYKDQVDSASDAYKHLMRLIRRGLVIKTAATHNLLHRSLFEQRFGMKIPNHAEVSAAVRIAPDASRPSGFCITARAPENWYMGDVIFIMAAARLYTDNPIQVLTALQQALVRTCEKGVNHPSVIWLNKGASDILQVTAQKMDMHLCEFTDDATAGIPETNYYLQPVTRPSPFYKAPGGLPRIGAARCYALVDDLQWDEDDVKDEDGMLSLRQDWSSWSYTDKGEVQPFAGITLDCLRMNLYCFALSATGLTSDERLYAQLPANLQPAAVAAKLHTPEFVEAYFAQNHAITMLRIKEAEERSKLRRTPGGIEHVGAQAVTRRFSRGYRR
jgi:phage terminase large subunit-like protein